MRFRSVSRLNHPVWSVSAIAGFVVLTTAWLDARAQEVNRRHGPVPLLWPFAPDPDADRAPRHGMSFAGPTAPDFTLPDLRTGRPVSLSEFRGRPTVLVFGSFTCTYFCNGIPDIHRLHQRYGDRAHFLFVHVRDARHRNADLLEFMRLTGHSDSARAGIDKYGFDFPCLDAEDFGPVEQMYSPYPQRLVLLDAAGDVHWDSLPGARAEGLRFAEAEQQLQQLLTAGG